MTETLVAWWEEIRRSYDALVVEHLGIDGRLGDIATYALARGKRVRPLLAEAIGDTVGATPVAITRVALAAEYLHTASLLLDDLPAMDSARERRGAEAAHLAFSEADAILASVGLVARSYAIALGERDDDPFVGRAIAQRLSDAIVGMAGGQSLELAMDEGWGGDEVAAIHQRKTAGLFVLVSNLISTASAADEATATNLVRFAAAFGAAYQIGDDLQDRGVEGERRGNLACVLGPGPAREKAYAHLEDARSAIIQLGRASTRLAQCVDWLAESLEAKR